MSASGDGGGLDGCIQRAEMHCRLASEALRGGDLQGVTGELVDALDQLHECLESLALFGFRVPW
jgi:hypothetical protein